MSGTITGGRKAAITNKSRYGDNFYSALGSKGGKISRGGGFASMEPAKRSEAGRKGGAKSRRGKDTYYTLEPEPKLTLFTKLKLRIFK